jgi:hypothetical protein
MTRIGLVTKHVYTEIKQKAEMLGDSTGVSQED